MSFEPVGDLSVKLDELDKEIIQMKDNLNIVQEAKHQREKEIFELSEAIRKAKFNISKKVLEKEIVTREFWRNRP